MSKSSQIICIHHHAAITNLLFCPRKGARPHPTFTFNAPFDTIRTKMLRRVTDKYQVLMQVSYADGFARDVSPMIQCNGEINGQAHDPSHPTWMPTPRNAKCCHHHNEIVCVCM
eukprot:610762_1